MTYFGYPVGYPLTINWSTITTSADWVTTTDWVDLNWSYTSTSTDYTYTLSWEPTSITTTSNADFVWANLIFTDYSWDDDFITNERDIENRLHEYEAAAKKAGVELIVKSDAYDSWGNLIKDSVAIHISDSGKRQEFWKALEEIDTINELGKAETKKSFVLEIPEKLQIKLPKLCSCSMVALMRSGCNCGGE